MRTSSGLGSKPSVDTIRPVLGVSRMSDRMSDDNTTLNVEFEILSLGSRSTSQRTNDSGRSLRSACSSGRYRCAFILST